MNIFLVLLIFCDVATLESLNVLLYVCNLFCNFQSVRHKQIGQIFACDLSFQTFSGTFRKAEIPWLLQYTELYATFRF